MEGLRPGDPQRVGRYRLLKRLGTGGMGRVYLGQSPSGRSVAVKVIRAELADNADFRQRFRLEVTAARRVGGMFTAPVVDADPDAPQPWMVTEFVSGPSLADAVASRGALSVNAVRILAAGLAEGLGAVHAAGLVHRDLKPSNVLLAADGPRIIDFGISRSAGTAGPTRTGGVIGSPGFMSPEQATGEPVGPASDIFSLGSVLAYAATGLPPFGEGPPSVLLYRVVHGSPATRNIPLELRPIIEHCLVRDPAKRPTTDQLLVELGEAAPVAGWLDGQVSGPDPLRPPCTEPSKAPRARALAAAVSADGSPAGLADVPAGVALPVPAEGARAYVPAHAALAGGRAVEGLLPGVSADLVPASAPGPEGEVPDSLPPWTGQPSGPAVEAAAGEAPGAAGGGSSLDWLAPDRSDGPPLAAAKQPPVRGDRRRTPARLAAAGVLGVVIAGTLALSLLSRHDPQTALGSAGTHRRGTSAVARTSGKSRGLAPGQSEAPLAAGTYPPPAVSGGGGSATPGPSSSPFAGGPAAVVLAYFGAINHQNWAAAWALGGDNLYSSMAGLIADYAGVTNEDVAILGVTGDAVTARIRTTLTTGVVVVHTPTFIVQYGMITARVPGPPPPGGPPPGGPPPPGSGA